MTVIELVVTLLVLALLVLALLVIRQSSELASLRDTAKAADERAIDNAIRLAERGTGVSSSPLAGAGAGDEWAQREVIAWEYIAQALSRLADAMSAYTPAAPDYPPDETTGRAP